MQTPDCIYDFCRVDSAALFVEPCLFPKISKEFTSVEKIDNEIELGLCLKSVMEVHNVWVLNFLQDIALS